MILSGHLGIRLFQPISIAQNDNMFYASVGLAFSGKGYKTKNLYKLHKDVVITGKAWSIDVPARFGYKFKVNKDISILAELGFVGSFGLFGKWKDSFSGTNRSSGEYYNMDNRDPYGSQRIDAGLSGRAGIEFQRITASVGYDYGIVNMAGSPYHSKSRNIQISVGYLF